MKDINALQKALEEDMSKQYGPMLSGDDLLKALGYVSKQAFTQSIYRKTVPVPIFKIENRRGYFALVKDVAKYLAEKRCSVSE